MNSSAGYDRGVKLRLYARSGVPEVWLVDLNRESVEVHRGPAGDAYSESRTLARGQDVAPGAFADAVMAVDGVLG
jgi:Uma2 family endonuclease